MKASRKLFKGPVRIVIRISGKKIVDLSLPEGSSVSIVEKEGKHGPRRTNYTPR